MVFVGIIDKNASEKVNVDAKGQQSELDKFLATAIISVLIGILTLGFGWDYAVAEQWLANGAITLYIYWIAKIIAIRIGWIKLPQPLAQT